MQRFCGSLGYGCGSILTGWLIDWYSYGKSIKDYRPAVMMAIVLLLTDLSIALNMNVNIFYFINRDECFNNKINLKIVY